MGGKDARARVFLQCKDRQREDRPDAVTNLP